MTSPCGALSAFLLTAVLATPATAEEDIGIRLPARSDLNALTDLVVEVTGVSMQYDPQKLRGDVKLSIQGAHDAVGIWRIYNTVLHSQGFTTLALGDPPVYHIAPLNDAQRIAPITTTTQLDALPYRPGYVNLRLQLAHLPAEQANSIAGTVLGGRQRGQVAVIDERSGDLLVGGPTDQILELRELLAELDRPGLQPAIRSYQPQRAATRSLLTAANAAWQARNRIGGSNAPVELQISTDGRAILAIAPEEQVEELLALMRELDLSQAATTLRYEVPYFSLDQVAPLLERLLAGDQRGDQAEKPTILIDPLTNSLVITGSDRVHQQAAAFLQRLAELPAERRRGMRSFIIEHRSAEGLVGVLNNLLQEGSTGATTAVSEGEQTNSPAGGSNGNDTVRLTTDAETNAIIAFGTPQQLDHLDGLIELLDKRQPQVAIELILVGMNDDEVRKLGVELARQWEDDGTTLNLSSIFGLAGGAPPNLERPDQATGLVSLLINPGDYGVLLQALETVTEGSNITRSRTVVNNNAEANINSVRQEPIASINASDTVATSTFAGTSDAGTILSLKPTIGSADYITLAYSIEQSQFQGESTATANGATVPPPKQQDAISSTAHIPDGHIIALGGLVREREATTTQRVPWLGRIPIIGWMWRNEQRDIFHSYQYAFIKVDILRHDRFEDLRHLSQGPLEEAGIEELGWPTLTPRFIR